MKNRCNLLDRQAKQWRLRPDIQLSTTILVFRSWQQDLRLENGQGTDAKTMLTQRDDGRCKLENTSPTFWHQQGCQIHQKQKWSMESCWWFCHNHFYKSLFEDVTSKGLTDLARCVGSEPPKCRLPHANGILRVSIWTAQSVLAQPKASTSLW